MKGVPYLQEEQVTRSYNNNRSSYGKCTSFSTCTHKGNS